MKKITLETRIFIGFALALACMLLAGLQMYRSLNEYIETSKLVAHTHVVLEDLDSLSTRLREIESGQRAYLITSDPVFLEEQGTDSVFIDTVLNQLKILVQDNPNQIFKLDALAKLIDVHLDLLDSTINAFKENGFEAARERVKQGQSRRGMDAIQKLVLEMSLVERALLTERTSLAQTNANVTLIVGGGLSILSILGLSILWIRARREARNKNIADAAIHQSVLLSQVMDLLPVGVVVSDLNGRHTSINPAALKIWETEPGVHFFQNEELGVWETETERILSAEQWGLTRTLKTGETIRNEVIDIHCFNGARKTVSTYSMGIRNEKGLLINGLLVFVDVTEFKKKEQNLRAAALFDETQARSLALFSESFDRNKILNGFLMLLASRHPVPVSALYIFNEWTGKFSCEASHGLGSAMPKEFNLGEGVMGEAARQNKSAVLDSSLLTIETGFIDFIPQQVHFIPVIYQDRRIAVLILATTVKLSVLELAFLDRLIVNLGVALDNLRQYSDLKQLTLQLRTSSNEISDKNLQLEDASRMKSEFLANMSHELRTPLNAIIGFSEVLRDGLLGELQPKQKEYISDIYTSGGHLLSLINDILDLSKVEAGKMSLELEACDSAGLVQAGLQVVREKAIAHRIMLSVEAAPDMPEIWLDQRKVKQIIYNLLSNAVKFTPDGGKVFVTAKIVENITRDLTQQFLEISVRDTGIGISADDQQRLFQPFVQIDSTLSRRYNGTGLGLVMVKRLTELHGGLVRLKSELGKGSTFTVLLPARKAHDELIDENHSDHKVEQLIDADNIFPSGISLETLQPTNLSAAPASEKLKAISQSSTEETNLPLALVIEDDHSAAELLRLQLETNGFRVITAESAERGLELADKQKPDLITLDIHLPGMDGWQCLEHLKEKPDIASIPVVIISIVADRARGLSLGANQVLQKPITRDELSRALAAVGFGRRHDERHGVVLVIDDDPKAVQLLGTHLDSAGYKVLSAFSGKQGIDIARESKPDLILLDLMMPELSGFDVIDELKNDVSTKDIPIIVVTAKQITQEDRNKLKGVVKKLLEKSDLEHGLFIHEVARAMLKDEVHHA